MPARRIRVLIVDGSAVVRKVLTYQESCVVFRMPRETTRLGAAPESLLYVSHLALSIERYAFEVATPGVGIGKRSKPNSA